MSKGTFTNSTKLNQNGWFFSDDSLDLFITEQGGQMMPVNFKFADGTVISPYYATPWQANPVDCDYSAAPVLAPLRGDFFCLPFGGNGDPWNGIRFTCHGETASGIWQNGKAASAAGETTLEYQFNMKLMPGKVTKRIRHKDQQPVLYIEHEVSGCTGKFPIGHHAILQCPEENEKMYLSTSPFQLGMTCPGIFSDPKNEEFGYLASGESFTSLNKMPTLFKDPAVWDYSTYPSPVGFTDLWAVFKKAGQKPEWTVACYPQRGYLWFVLKNSAVLPGTAVWAANAGRYEAPWNGKTRCIGIEDCRSFFASGVKESCEPNLLSEQGWDTTMEFSSDKPTSIRVIQGVAQIPSDFTRITNVDFTDGKVKFNDCSGASVTADVDWKFLF